MPTNEERREVARSIRNADLTKHASYYEEVKGWDHVRATRFVLVSNLGSAIGIDKAIFSIDDLKIRLADLIEPEPERTCKFVHHECRHPGEKDPCGKYQDCEWACAKDSLYCSSCDKRVAVSFAEQLKVKKYSFCPYCGAKVIEE
jgi:DNA-directed RNA polymerase subunit RPC12/RpoP